MKKALMLFLPIAVLVACGDDDDSTSARTTTETSVRKTTPADGADASTTTKRRATTTTVSLSDAMTFDGNCNETETKMSIKLASGVPDVSTIVVVTYKVEGKKVGAAKSDRVIVRADESNSLTVPTPPDVSAAWLAAATADDMACDVTADDTREATEDELTTTTAPTTTVPPTTVPPTPNDQFVAALYTTMSPEWVKTNLPDREPFWEKAQVDKATKTCDEFRNGMVWGGEQIDGTQAAAWVYEVAEDHDSAKLARLAVQFLCPDLQPVLDAAIALPPPPTQYYAGVYLVGTEIQPGAYEATGDLDGCYWERQDANGEIIDNNFIQAAKRAQVTIKASDYAFMTNGGCGGWLRIG